MPTFHVALDEAGCFRFDPHGSRYYIFSACYTYDPAPLARALTDLRFSLLKQGHNLPSFHCATDLQANRDAVVERMLADTSWRFAAVVVEKRKVNPAIRAPETFYPKFAMPLLRFIFRGCIAPGTDRLVICTDSLPTRRKEAVEKAFKLAIAQELPGLEFWTYHHPRHSNKWIQIADYCAWGIQKKWERNDQRTYDALRPRMTKRELDLCGFGDQTTYY